MPQVYYTQADGSWVAKSFPESWRQENESDQDMAKRLGFIFDFPDGWDIMQDTPVIEPDPPPVIPPTIMDLQAQIMALTAQVQAIAKAVPIGPGQPDQPANPISSQEVS